MKIKYLFLFIMVLLLFIPKENNFNINDYETKTIKVEVKGEVENPGVFSLPAYSSVEELLSQVTLKPEADLSTLNLTTILKNNDVIVIGKLAEKISINSASLSELVTLPGIGPVIGQRIIDYRNNNGPFQQLEAIKNVKGIGDKTYEKICELISL